MAEKWTMTSESTPFDIYAAILWEYKQDMKPVIDVLCISAYEQNVDDFIAAYNED